ncbi:MAG: response regulator [Polyangiaceae bacterium]|nr:response regulator [Polyangiaceae bacterium]
MRVGETESRLAYPQELERLHSLLTEERAARLRAEATVAELKRTLVQTDAMLEAAPLGVALCDSSLRYVKVNEAFAFLNGMARDAHIGRRVDEAGPAVTDAILALFRRALDEGEAIKNVELCSMSHTSPGTTQWWMASFYPVRIEGRVAGIMILAIDTTEQKRVDHSLGLLTRASSALTASLDLDVTLNSLARVVVPELADLCIVFLKGEGDEVRVATVVHADPTKAELIRVLSERYPNPPDAPHGYQYVLRTGRTDIVPVMTDDVLASVACNEEHLRLLRELGSTSGVVVPLAVSGRVIGAMMLLCWESGRCFTHRDVALAEEIGRFVAVAIEHAEDFQAAKHERSRAEQANRLKDEFLAVVSHELRTPLNAVLGWTRMLRAGNVDTGRTAKALAMIERNTLAQAQLIEDLLDVGRIVAGKMRLTICPVHLPHVIAAAVDSMRPAADAKEILLEEDIDPEASPVMGDSSRLQQIAFNLINNAVKFTSRRGCVKIILRRVDRCVELAVEDTGRGIPRDFLPHVFERFRQAESSMTKSQGGLGLGLAIVKHLVELHGGSIEALSEGEGKGTTVIVRLPIGPLRIMMDEVETSARPSWPPSQPLSFGCTPALDGLTVLVVDNEPNTVSLLRALLEQSKARVLTAASAAEAMTIVHESRPSAIVADVALPGEDGCSLLRRLRSLPDEQGGRIPAIALTAFTETKEHEQALESGFNLHLRKPADPNELVLALASLAGRTHS